MKLYIENDNVKIEIKEIEGVPEKAETIVLFSSMKMRSEDIRDLERKMKRKLKKNVVILDATFRDKIYGV